MSYVTRLIGNLQHGRTDASGRPQLPDIHIERAHIREPRFLRDEYGTLGRGLEHIIGNPYVNGILSTSASSELIVNANNLQGLDNISEPEQNVMKELLTAQHRRSQMLYRLASTEELQAYDRVTKGVFKGTTLGAAIGGILNGVQYMVFRFNVPELTEPYLDGWINKGGKVLTELTARAGPGLYEASAISHEVFERRAESTTEKHIGQLIIEAFKELPNDTLAIGKTAFSKELWYDAINVGGWIDKARGRNGRERREKYTEEWTEAQKNAPPRGIILLGLVQGLKAAVPEIDDYTLSRIVYGAIEGVTTAYINVGNNFQGCLAVYHKCVEDARQAGSNNPHRDGFLEFASDPFQLSNLIVVTTWNLGEVVIRAMGFRPERPLVQSLESSILSWDTAAAAQISKLFSKYPILLAWYSVRPYNLMILALDHRSIGLQEKLMTQYGGRRAFEKYKRKR